MIKCWSITLLLGSLLLGGCTMSPAEVEAYKQQITEDCSIYGPTAYKVRKEDIYQCAVPPGNKYPPDFYPLKLEDY